MERITSRWRPRPTLASPSARLARAQGRGKFWAHVVIHGIRSPEGDLVGFAKITRDLTERRAAETKLRESDQQFRLLVQRVTDYAIFMLDVRGHVASWNAGAQRIKGYAPEEIIGRHFSNFYTEADCAPAACKGRARPTARPRPYYRDSRQWGQIRSCPFERGAC
jgi:PAS domain-containing protein